MKKTILKDVFVIFLLLVFAGFCSASQESKELLPDGFVISGVDGKVVGPDSEGIYKFIPDMDISDGKNVIKAGVPLDLLESAALLKMLDNYRPGENYGFRMSARVTAYGGKNYLFPVYFLPYKQLDKDKQFQQIKPKVNEPNDRLIIPESILEKLTSGKEILPIEQRPGLELKEDYILSDRTGRIVKQNTGQYAFTFDSLGRNVDKTRIMLLPCQALERALSEQKNDSEPARIKGSGIITKYKDNLYLLLQRTSRVYNNGNFPG